MATYRLSIIWNSGNTGFSETWYRKGDGGVNDTPIAAAALTFQARRGFSFPRGTSTSLVAVRASDVNFPRYSKLTFYDDTAASLLQATRIGDYPTGGAILMALRSISGKRKPFLLRGLRDMDLTRNAAGRLIPNALMRNDIDNWFNNVVNAGLLMRYLQGADAVGGPRVVGSFQTANNGQATNIIYGGGAIALPNTVLLHGVSAKLYPQFQGPLKVYGTGVDGQLQVRKRFPGPNSPIPLVGATVYPVAYTYENFASYEIEDVRTHKVGRPFLSTVGKKRGVTYKGS